MFDSKIYSLEKENEKLKQENKNLVEKNEKLTKQVLFYKRAVDKSFRSHKDESPDLEVVTEPNEGYYQRVEESSKNKNFAKMFLMLTIFTIIVQTINVNPGASDVFNAKEATSQLNFFDIEKLTANFHQGLSPRPGRLQ